MLPPMNINDTSIASDDLYDRLRTIINNREEDNNLDEYTKDGDLESDDIVCSV